jgi:hypothetical protein
MRVARYGYARVSTRSQTDDSQLDALTAAGCERIWTDTASGKLARRPEWDKCLDYVRAGDELVVIRLSRMARSVRHLTEIAALLADRGVDPRRWEPAGRWLLVAEADADICPGGSPMAECRQLGLAQLRGAIPV